jgi:FdhD protein
MLSQDAIHNDLPPPVRRVPRGAWRDGSMHCGERSLAEETPVAFAYDGSTYAVLMATPSDLDDFALGFSCTEGIIATGSQISELKVIMAPDGIVLQIWLSEERSRALAARRRHLIGPAGCGMCGLESLAEANRTVPVSSSSLQVSRSDIANAVAALPAKQELNTRTRAVHAAAFWERHQSLIIREDVGRHNALDKLAGAMLRTGRSAAGGIVVLSSRISVELVQKAAVMAASVVVGVSAPTALAVRVAETAGITLVGVARDDGFEIFTHPERIRSEY